MFWNQEVTIVQLYEDILNATELLILFKTVNFMFYKFYFNSKEKAQHYPSK